MPTGLKEAFKWLYLQKKTEAMTAEQIKTPLSDTRRRAESVCYVVMWGLVAAFYLLNVIRARSVNGEQPLFEWGMAVRAFVALVPFVALFIVNNCILIPRLLLRGRFALYFIAAVAAIFLVWLYQYEQFMEFLAKIGPPPEGARGPRPHRFHRPLGAMPLFLDFVYDLLVVGMNIATALIFQNYRYRLERQRLSRANAESQLTYLKDQINPHFYMNMLNNIHGMIEIDPEKAQDMVLRMSKLMRYMLYESSKPKIPLSREIEFLRDYLQIMRQRYPESKVKIEAEFPSAAESGSIMVAPLFYLVYIENAFKHGISYQAVSRVSVKISIGGDKVTFDCENTVAADSKADKSGDSHGIGLQNASKRLQLIYGDSFTLTEGEESDEGEENKLYRVSLTIPKQK